MVTSNSGVRHEIRAANPPRKETGHFLASPYVNQVKRQNSRLTGQLERFIALIISLINAEFVFKQGNVADVNQEL